MCADGDVLRFFALVGYPFHFRVKYKENPSDLALLAEYADIMERAVEMDEAFQEWEDEDLNNEELKYYLEVNNRVMQMLVDAM